MSDERWVCRHCGCTDQWACEGGCAWEEANLCSRCAPHPTYVAIDLETGGLDHTRHALLEIGAVVLDQHGAEMSFIEDSCGVLEIGRFRQAVDPHPALAIDPESVQTVGLNLDALYLRAIPENEAMQDFAKWLELVSAEGAPLIPIAHRDEFDRRFLRAAAERQEVELRIGKTWLCSKRSFGAFLADKIDHVDDATGLANAARYVGHWDERDVQECHHDAFQDARACGAIWRFLLAQRNRPRLELRRLINHVQQIAPDNWDEDDEWRDAVDYIRTLGYPILSGAGEEPGFRGGLYPAVEG